MRVATGTWRRSSAPASVRFPAVCLEPSPGALYADARYDGFEELAGFAYAGVGLLYGAVIGAALGCWIGLVLRRYDGALATAALLLGLLGAGTWFWSARLLEAPVLFAIYLPSAGALIAPFVARAAGLSFATRKGRPIS